MYQNMRTLYLEGLIMRQAHDVSLWDTVVTSFAFVFLKAVGMMV